jgi:hypothetical protein
MHDVARYMDPPSNTVYPREYCYALLGDVRDKCVLDLGSGEGLDVVALAKRGLPYFRFALTTWPAAVGLCAV